MTTFWPDRSVERMPSAVSIVRPLRPVTRNAWLGPATLIRESDEQDQQDEQERPPLSPQCLRGVTSCSSG